jgi:hypothetical protein
VLESVVEVALRDGRSIRRQDALALVASLVGALMLARGTDDENLTSEILESTKSRAARLALGDSAVAKDRPSVKKRRSKRK